MTDHYVEFFNLKIYIDLLYTLKKTVLESIVELHIHSIKIQETGLIHSSLLQYSTTSLKSHKKDTVVQ